MRFDAHDRYNSHLAVCPTCRGEGLCLEGRQLLNASRREEGAPPLRETRPPAVAGGGPDEADDADDEDDDDEPPGHGHSCGAVVSSYGAHGGTCRAGWSVKVQTVTEDGATPEERAERNVAIRSALVSLCQTFGVPIVQVPVRPQEPPKP